MSSRYLLPCECGQSTPIETSQAGQTVTCACGRSVPVPTMRGIRQLQPAVEETAARRSPASSWNPTKGAMFAGGAILIVGGLIAVAYNYYLYSQYSRVQPSQELYDLELQSIEQSTPLELLELWQMVRTHGLGEHESSLFVRAREGADRYEYYSFAGGGCALVGVALAALSLLIPGKRPAR